MNPYYKDEFCTLYHGDCREILPAIPRVSATVTDPPYGDTSLAWDSWVEDWPSLINSDSLWCFGSFRMFMDKGHQFSGKWKLAQEVIWEKHNGSSSHKDRFRRVHEIVAQFYDASKKWSDVFKRPLITLDAKKRTVRRKTRPPHWGDIGENTFRSEDGGPRLMRSVIYERSCHGKAQHPTQKPLKLVSLFLQYSVPSSDSVIDPFCGSGTTLVGAKILGMNAIGIESSEQYCEIAARRLSKEVLE